MRRPCTADGIAIYLGAVAAVGYYFLLVCTIGGWAPAVFIATCLTVRAIVSIMAHEHKHRAVKSVPTTAGGQRPGRGSRTVGAEGPAQGREGGDEHLPGTKQ